MRTILPDYRLLPGYRRGFLCHRTQSRSFRFPKSCRVEGLGRTIGFGTIGFRVLGARDCSSWRVRDA